MNSLLRKNSFESPLDESNDEGDYHASDALLEQSRLSTKTVVKVNRNATSSNTNSTRVKMGVGEVLGRRIMNSAKRVIGPASTSTSPLTTRQQQQQRQQELSQKIQKQKFKPPPDFSNVALSSNPSSYNVIQNSDAKPPSSSRQSLAGAGTNRLEEALQRWSGHGVSKQPGSRASQASSLASSLAGAIPLSRSSSPAASVATAGSAATQSRRKEKADPLAVGYQARTTQQEQQLHHEYMQQPQEQLPKRAQQDERMPQLEQKRQHLLQRRQQQIELRRQQQIEMKRQQQQELRREQSAFNGQQQDFEHEQQVPGERKKIIRKRIVKRKTSSGAPSLRDPHVVTSLRPANKPLNYKPHPNFVKDGKAKAEDDLREERRALRRALSQRGTYPSMSASDQRLIRSVQQQRNKQIQEQEQSTQSLPQQQQHVADNASHIQQQRPHTPMHSLQSSRIPLKQNNAKTIEQPVVYLESELNEMAVKHAEEMYWMRLELDTLRKSKKAVEDRVAELYRDVQDVLVQAKADHDAHADDTTVITNDVDPSTVIVKSEYISTLKNQVDKYKRMLRIMKHQTELIKSSSDNAVTALKDEISELMDEKTKTETHLMNSLAGVYREKRDLSDQVMKLQQQVANNKAKEEDTYQLKFDFKLVKAENKRLREQILDAKCSLDPQRSNSPMGKFLGDESTSFDYDGDPINNTNANGIMSIKEQQRQQIDLLNSTNRQLMDSLRHARQTMQSNAARWTQENTALRDQINNLTQELNRARSTVNETERMALLQKEKEFTLTTLDRLKLITQQANEATLQFENISRSLVANCGYTILDDGKLQITKELSNKEQRDNDHILSFLETTSLVYSQVKMSLMHIELKLRSTLMAVRSNQINKTDLKLVLGMPSTEDMTVTQLHDQILQNALDSIGAVEDKIETEIEQLRKQSKTETEEVKLVMAQKVADLKAMMSRQARLENQIVHIKQNNTNQLDRSNDSLELHEDKQTNPQPPRPGESQLLSMLEDLSGGDESQRKSLSSLQRDDYTNTSDLELFVSQKALETLQNEVLIVVQRVKDQNETIARLRSEIEEYRIRERTLMAELKRNINDQLSKQIKEKDQPTPISRALIEPDSITSDRITDSQFSTMTSNVSDYDDPLLNVEEAQLPLYYNDGGEQYPESDNEFSEDDEDDVSYEEVEYEEEIDEEVSYVDDDDEYEEYTVIDDSTLYDEQTVYDDDVPSKEKDVILDETIYENHDGDEEEEEEEDDGDEETLYDEITYIGD